jgi:hypothetical protein
MVNSIMLEVNRKLYLKEPSNEKSEEFNKIKEVIRNYIEWIRKNIQ